jgi:hypothetical protein
MFDKYEMVKEACNPAPLYIHEHYCGKCKRTYECGHKGCKLVFVRMCLPCKLIEDSENELEN